MHKFPCKTISLPRNLLTEEKTQIDIYANPNTTFLASTNATVEEINKHVVKVLFANERPLCYVVNGIQLPMAIYKNITVIITENRYFYSLIVVFNKIFDKQLIGAQFFSFLVCKLFTCVTK